MSRSLRNSEFVNTPDYQVRALKKQLKQAKNAHRIGANVKHESNLLKDDYMDSVTEHSEQFEDLYA